MEYIVMTYDADLGARKHIIKDVAYHEVHNRFILLLNDGNEMLGVFSADSLVSIVQVK